MVRLYPFEEEELKIQLSQNGSSGRTHVLYIQGPVLDTRHQKQNKGKGFKQVKSLIQSPLAPLLLTDRT